jgi:hypothetical protein
MSTNKLSVVKTQGMIGNVSKPAFWGRRLDTQPGEWTVIPEGVLDYANEPREFRNGEIVYVGNTGTMLTRRVIVFREFLGDIRMDHAQNFVGLGEFRCELLMTIKMISPIQYLQRCASDRLQEFSDDIVAEIEKIGREELRRSFAKTDRKLNSLEINQQVVNRSNKYLRDYGLTISRNESIVSSIVVPDVVREIIAECRVIDEWLVTHLPHTAYRETQIRRMKELFRAVFSSSEIADTWLAGINAQQRGAPFFSIVMNHISVDQLRAFVNQHALSASKLIDYKHTCVDTDIHVTDSVIMLKSQM